jgi:hypothetical protein
MNKALFHKGQFKQSNIFNMALALTILSLLVSWAVEVLALEIFCIG